MWTNSGEGNFGDSIAASVVIPRLATGAWGRNCVDEDERGGLGAHADGVSRLPAAAGPQSRGRPALSGSAARACFGGGGKRGQKGQALGRSRGGFTTKIHAKSDRSGNREQLSASNWTRVALVEEIAITPANINDGKAGPDALPDDPGEVFADSAYQGRHFGDAVRAKGGTPRVVATGMWGRNEAETLARLDAWNRPIHRIRSRIEKIFGTWKRSYGLRRMRWLGLAKATVQIRLTAIADNLKRGLTIVATAH